jgi:hypothetical protein
MPSQACSRGSGGGAVPIALAERAPQIREAVALTDLIYSMSATKTGGVRHVRWQMAAGCQLSITPLAMPGPFDWLVTQTYVVSHHLLKSNEKALAFAEGDQGCGGQGLLLPDDQPGSANRNNLSRSVALVFVQPCIQFYDNASEWAAAWETLSGLARIFGDVFRRPAPARWRRAEPVGRASG